MSRRVEGEERNELRDAINGLDVPQGMSVIARTAGIGRTTEELQWDLNYLMQLWRAVEDAAKMQPGAYLIYQESSLVIRAIRDYFHPDIGELLIDTEAIYEQAQQFMSHVMPANVNRVKLYKDDVPLFSRFQIEHQIETAYARQVPLPSGGAIVIDHTEALVSVDVNSARATKGGDIETTAFNTNAEAADEIARQLRLRDLGGLIVIDFIDMESTKNQREVETRLRDALKYDRARVQLGKISRFGLMELSRQRLRPALAEAAHIPCPRCHGIGHIRGTESTALHILRIIQEEAMKDNTAQVVAQVPVDVGTFLLNEKRTDVLTIETRFKVNVLLVPNIHLETPNYTVERLRHDDLNQSEPLPPSFEMVQQPEQVDPAKQMKEEAAAPRQEAMVKGITPAQPAPEHVEKPAATPTPVTPQPAADGTWLSKVLGWFRTKPAPVAAPETKAARDERAQDRSRDGRRNERRGDDRNRGDGRRGSGERRDEARDGRRGGEQRRDKGGEARGDAARAQGQPRNGQGQGQPKREERREDRRDGNRGAQTPREPQRPKEPRERGSEGALTAEAVETQGPPGAPPQAGAADTREGGSRRRRGRRGRGGDRADRADNGEAGGAQDASADNAPSVTDVVGMVAETPATEGAPVREARPPKPPREPRPPREQREPREPREVREPREPRAPREGADAQASLPVPAQNLLPIEAPAQSTLPIEPPAPAAIPAPAPAPAPREIRAAPAQPVAPPVVPNIPPIALTLPPESNLVLVETSRAAPPAEEPEAPRPKRTRPPKVEIKSEPLEIIETRKEPPSPAA